MEKQLVCFGISIVAKRVLGTGKSTQFEMLHLGVSEMLTKSLTVLHSLTASCWISKEVLRISLSRLLFLFLTCKISVLSLNSSMNNLAYFYAFRESTTCFRVDHLANRAKFGVRYGVLLQQSLPNQNTLSVDRLGRMVIEKGSPGFSESSATSAAKSPALLNHAFSQKYRR